MSLRRLLAGGSWRPGFLAVGWALLSLYYVVPVSEVLAPNLDSSIRATYAYFTAHGFQFGSEVSTTAGPYGFVMYGWDYGGDLFWPRWLLTLLFSAALAALVLWFFLAARSRWVRWLWLAAAVLGIEYGDNEYNLCLLLGALFLAEHHQRANRRVATLLVIWLFGCLSLMKGTQLAVAFGIVAALAFLSLSQRAWRSAAFLVFSFLISVVFWWAVAGQNPLHLPTYVNHLRHIAQGYNEAMALYESPGVFQIGLSLLVAIAALLGRGCGSAGGSLPPSPACSCWSASDGSRGSMVTCGPMVMLLFSWILASSSRSPLSPGWILRQAPRPKTGGHALRCSRWPPARGTQPPRGRNPGSGPIPFPPHQRGAAISAEYCLCVLPGPRAPASRCGNSDARPSVPLQRAFPSHRRKVIH